MPIKPSDLRNIPAVHYANAATGLSLTFKTPDGMEEAVNLTPAIYVNSIGMLLEGILKGIGYARAPSFAVNGHLKEGRLIHLLTEYQSLPKHGVYAIYPDKRFLPLKVRKFIDLLSDRLGSMDDESWYIQKRNCNVSRHLPTSYKSWRHQNKNTKKYEKNIALEW